MSYVPISADTDEKFNKRIAKRGFTLVELLVVVSIIALLISILMPALGKAKALAKMVKCMTNLRAIGTAAQLYASFNNQCVPRGMSGGCNNPHSVNFGHYQYAIKLSPYVGGPWVPFEHDEDWDYAYEVFKNIPAYRCPTFTDPDFPLTYVVNARNFERNPDDLEAASVPADNLPRPPSEIPYVCGVNPYHYYIASHPKAYGIYDLFFDEHLVFDRNGDPNPQPRMIRADDMRHDGRATLVFFDGHTESRKLSPEELPLELFYPPLEED